MAGALEGLMVLDLSWGTAGPMTTMFLADNGADVIRIEPPSGDPFAGQTGYRVWNRGKRSAVLDLKSDEGRRDFLALAARADVVIDSFSPGTGSQFALLPPQNATGNFTKIVQRLPVRIHIDAGDETRRVLIPGLSVTVHVDTRGGRASEKRLERENSHG